MEPYTVKESCNTIAPGWEMQVGGGDERMVNSCLAASK